MLFLFRGAFVFCFLFGASVGMAAAGQEAPNVIVLTLSGVRNSESTNDPWHQYIPRFWNELKKEGVFYSNLQTMDQEFHQSAVLSALASGLNQTALRNLEAPTIFQYIRKKYNWPREKIWLLGRWMPGKPYVTTQEFGSETYPSEVSMYMDVTPEDKRFFSDPGLNFIEQFRHFGEGMENPFPFSLWDNIDEKFYSLFQEIIEKANPKFVEFILAGAEAAHYDTFARYVLSLKRTDEMTFEIWQMIQKNAFYRNNTYLFVVVDHERDSYYMQHGEHAYNNRTHVWMYVYGPDVKRGVVIDRPVYHTDIFATIAKIMDVQTHPTPGRVLSDCFVETSQRGK